MKWTNTRILLKIIAVPFVVALTVSWAVLIFLSCWAEKILKFVSGIMGLIAIILFIMGQTTGGILYAVTAFLISPVGLPLIAKRIIDLLDGLNDALKDFITK